MDLYYTPPKEESFTEVKNAAIELWKTYNDEYGYATKKINCIKDISNSEDNFMCIVVMFDMDNQKKLAEKLSTETRKEIRDRFLAGGAEEIFCPF